MKRALVKPKLNATSELLKADYSGKKLNRVKTETAKSSSGKKPVLKNIAVKQPISKNTSETADSAKKNNSLIKPKTIKTKAIAKQKISKNPATTTKAALVTNSKKTVSNAKSVTLKPKKIAQKISSKPSAKTKPETAEKQISTVKKSTKLVRKKVGSFKTIIGKSKAKSQVAVKTKSAQNAKLSKPKSAIKLVRGNQKADLKRKKSADKTVSAKKTSPPIKSKIDVKTISIVKKAQIKSKPIRKSVKITGAGLVSRKNKTAEAVKPLKADKKNRITKNKIVEKVSAKKLSKLKNPVNSIPAEIKKPRKKPVRPISSAVFRGKKSLYDFKVFSLDEKFEPVQAVYIISRRVTDRRKRGHHKLICIGQTDSVSEGIKMHKKGKCIRQNEANVICLLKEEDEKNRLRIEADLREAHSVSCNQQ